jgi:hypothetical protein
VINHRLILLLKNCPLSKDNSPFRNPEGGSVLIISLYVLMVLVLLMAGFSATAVNEMNLARRLKNSTAAFWAAEMAIHRFINDTHMLDGGDQIITEGDYTVTLTKDDTDKELRYVKAIATGNDVTRGVEVTFIGNTPNVFKNALSSGGNMLLTGNQSSITVNGPTRLTGTFTMDPEGEDLSATFSDFQDYVDPSVTTFKYPDINGNSVQDEFDDFINLQLINIYETYLPSEVIYYPTNQDLVIITPNASLAHKKMIFVQGSQAGKGNVAILFNGSWKPNQNLTIVSTGAIDYVQPLQAPGAENSKLNTISWYDYTESTILTGKHAGVMYTHAQANFNSIYGQSTTNGIVMANEGIVANETIHDKIFNYHDPYSDNSVPAGFRLLFTAPPAGYNTEPNSWKEVLS